MRACADDTALEGDSAGGSAKSGRDSTGSTRSIEKRTPRSWPPKSVRPSLGRRYRVLAEAALQHRFVRGIYYPRTKRQSSCGANSDRTATPHQFEYRADTDDPRQDNDGRNRELTKLYELFGLEPENLNTDLGLLGPLL